MYMFCFLLFTLPVSDTSPTLHDAFSTRTIRNQHHDAALRNKKQSQVIPIAIIILSLPFHFHPKNLLVTPTSRLRPRGP
ncbi:hypothetical protein F5Y15DRAFT_339939 [Xylariaceae sp. FL0016]|nr:hypothetical protein F5Y15DRAFT_339939 [Xylariaceae sp. FL0016]